MIVEFILVFKINMKGTERIKRYFISQNVIPFEINIWE